MTNKINKAKIATVAVCSFWLVACTQTPTQQEASRELTIDEAFCQRQNGTYIDGAYPTCLLPDGTELQSTNFYQH